MDEYIGIIKIFGGNFAPRGWMMCNGQLLSIAQNSALFAILGTTYGGDGVTTFALPNLQSRAPIGMGQGPGLSRYVEGQIGGVETATLTIGNMPAHTHVAQLKVSSANASQTTATANSTIATPGTLSGRTFTATEGFNTSAPDITMNSGSVTNIPAGSNQPFGIMQPYIAMNYIICVQGLFPSRN